jgi:hypothetical protein
MQEWDNRFLQDRCHSEIVDTPVMTWHGSSNTVVPKVALQMLLIRNEINLMIRRTNNLEAGAVERSESVRY